MSDSCNHQTVYVNCSSAAADAGFVRPSPEERTLAMSKTGRLARGTYLAREDAVDDEHTFPGPLVLPQDHITENPSEQGQSCKDWFAMQTTQQRCEAISTRNRIYLYNPPSLKHLSEEMQSWMNPILPQGIAPGPERWTWTLKEYRQLIVYLRAFFTTMHISQCSLGTTHFVPIQGRKRVHFADAPKTSVVGFTVSEDGEAFEIRHRPSPDGLSRMQLNVSDLKTALLQNKAQAAHSVVMVVNHDLYEDEEEEYITERVWVADGVAIISAFRHNPSFDGLADIDGVHRWPASHCQAYVDQRLTVLNNTKDSTTRNHPFKAYGKPSGDSALGLAIQAANQAGQPSSMEDLSNLWFARVLFAVSRGAPVSQRGIEREKAWVEEHYAELKKFCSRWNKIPQFAAFEAWLGKRLEDRKGNGDAGETAGPSNKEALATARPKTILDMVDIRGDDDAGETTGPSNEEAPAIARPSTMSLVDVQRGG
ncbi:hypothetical protein H9Q69_013350 [Fusarium xylarioides]|nr:hypothetical protein H9Q70_008039 [Fusarium xylarioides]KAG5787580.1 hypothetical protein H9Q69_013350 [Fusarium xylarioides]KAG5803943.1 hypothetical protein H9Q71_011468 [Fusarium xylarioides]KAG5816282.1 hypothetical protein H9Q74_011212 [Fusarium xylarioides]